MGAALDVQTISQRMEALGLGFMSAGLESFLSDQSHADLPLTEAIARLETETGQRISYEELAERTGLGKATVNRWANSDVDMHVLNALCEFFNVQPGDMLAYRPEEPVTESDVERAIREARERGLGTMADLIEAPAR